MFLFVAHNVGDICCVCFCVFACKRQRASSWQRRNLPELPGWEIVKPNLVPRWEMVKPILHLLSQSSPRLFQGSFFRVISPLLRGWGSPRYTYPQFGEGWKLTEILRACTRQLLQNGFLVSRIGPHYSTVSCPCWRSRLSLSSRIPSLPYTMSKKQQL